MTAISAVRIALRPARLTLFLVAVALAVIATALVNSQSVFACEASRRHVHQQPTEHPVRIAYAVGRRVSAAPPATGRTRHFQATAVRRARPSTTRLLAVRPVAFVARSHQSMPALTAQPPAQAATQPPAPVTLPAVPAPPPNPVANPAAPSHPIASSGPARTGFPVLSGSDLATRLESAISLGALACLVPLLALVVLLQLRLLRLVRSRQPAAAAEPARPVTRHYSLTQEQARQLAPDLLMALAHHRFCESQRHEGRQKRASWLELEERESEPTRMWGTCETCHHERMTELSGHGRLATR